MADLRAQHPHAGDRTLACTRQKISCASLKRKSPASSRGPGRSWKDGTSARPSRGTTSSPRVLALRM
eukprot:6185538-Alexandrium_andersonii.AAC.1